jgi:hypothetical protein
MEYNTNYLCSKCLELFIDFGWISEKEEIESERYNREKKIWETYRYNRKTKKI